MSKTWKEMLSEMTEQIEMQIDYKLCALCDETDVLDAKWKLEGEFNLKQRDLIVELLDEVELLVDWLRICRRLSDTSFCYQSEKIALENREAAAADE